MKTLYEKHFKNRLSKKAFRELMKYAKLKRTDLQEVTLIDEANPYDELMFIYKIHPSRLLKLKHKSQEVHISQPGDFIGMIEAVSYLKNERYK